MRIDTALLRQQTRERRVDLFEAEAVVGHRSAVGIRNRPGDEAVGRHIVVGPQLLGNGWGHRHDLIVCREVEGVDGLRRVIVERLAARRPEGPSGKRGRMIAALCGDAGTVRLDALRRGQHFSNRTPAGISGTHKEDPARHDRQDLAAEDTGGPPEVITDRGPTSTFYPFKIWRLHAGTHAASVLEPIEKGNEV